MSYYRLPVTLHKLPRGTVADFERSSFSCGEVTDGRGTFLGPYCKKIVKRVKKVEWLNKARHFCDLAIFISMRRDFFEDDYRTLPGVK
jgi:hypothetical protein